MDITKVSTRSALYSNTETALGITVMPILIYIYIYILPDPPPPRSPKRQKTIHAVCECIVMLPEDDARCYETCILVHFGNHQTLGSCLKKNMNASLSISQSKGKNVKTFRWDLLLLILTFSVLLSLQLKKLR